jgi:predicted Zn-dependent protease
VDLMRRFLFGLFTLGLTLQLYSSPQLLGPVLVPRPATTLSTAINFFSPQQDIEIGADSSTEAEKEFSLVQDVGLNRYIRSVGQRLLQDAAASTMRYQFRLVNSREVSSLGFPNGAIYVYRGLLELMANDDEIAAILAHEIGHIKNRHATAQLSRQLLVQAPISIAAGLPTQEGWKDHLMKLGVLFGVRAPFLHYNREQEVEAALSAVRFMAEAGFNPQTVGTVLQKISDAPKRGEAVFAPFLYNHPANETLLDEIEAEIVRIGLPARASRASVDFRTFHTSLKRVPQPVLQNDPPPTPNEIVPNIYNHPRDYYRLCYPQGWLVTSQAGSNGAIIAPADGLHVGDDVSHGFMFDLFDISTSERPLTLEQATYRLIVYLRQRNQSMRAVPGAQTPMLIHDEPGLRTVLIGRSNVTHKAEVVWVVTRMYYQSVFYMVFVAPEDEFATYQPVFEEIIRSIQLR